MGRPLPHVRKRGRNNEHSLVRQVGARASGQPCSPVVCCPQSSTTSKQKGNAGSLNLVRSQAYKMFTKAHALAEQSLLMVLLFRTPILYSRMLCVTKP